MPKNQPVLIPFCAMVIDKMINNIVREMPIVGSLAEHVAQNNNLAYYKEN